MTFVAPKHPALNLNHLVSFIRCWQNFLELNSKGLYQSSGKEKERCPVFPSATKREIRHSRCSRATTAKKCTKSVMRVQSCYFANITLLLFCRSPCHCRRCCLSFLIRAWLCERCSQLLAWAKGSTFFPYKHSLKLTCLGGWPFFPGQPFFSFF